MGRLGIALVLGIAASLALAGCLGATEDDPVEEASAPSEPGAATAAADRPAAAARVGADSPLPSEPPAEGERGLDEAPTYRTGEWWSIEAEFKLSGNEATIKRVVAGTQGDDYLIGMPTESWNDEAIVVHFPGFGRIDRSNLSFHAHDRHLEFLDFPLEEGKTWETQWYGGSPMEAEVTSVDGSTAEVHVEGGSNVVDLTYDAEVGAVTSFEVPGYLRYEVTGHGYGHEGDVRVPANQDLVFCHGRAALAVPVEACQLVADSPRGPVETVDLPDTYDGVSYALLAADLSNPDGVAGAGAHRVQVDHPNGESETLTKLPSEPGYKLSVGGEDEPAGTWTVEAEAAGAGLAILEGVGYDSYEATLGGST
jgi:hypothetical protein